jgi:MFS family permease
MADSNKNITKKGKINPNVILLSIVSLVNDFSSEMIMPILPMFLESLGGTGKVIGLVGGLRDSVSSILKILSGYWSDKTGKRKIFVYAGYFISSVFKVLLAISTIWPTAVVFSSLERIGKGLRTAPRDAIIAESGTIQRGKIFGIHRSLETIGAILGAIGALCLFWFGKLSFKTVIMIAGILGFLALIPVYFVKETHPGPQNVSLKMGLKGLSKPLKLFIIISSVFALGNFSYMFFILKAQQHFSNRLAVIIPILLYILFNISYSALAVFFGSISDKIGREKVIILGYLIFSITSIGFVFLNSIVGFIFLFILYGMMYAAIDGNQRAYVADLASSNLKATALGTFHTMTGLMALPAGLIAGFLWDSIGPNAVFIYGGSLGLLSVLLFILFRNNFNISISH